MGKGGGGGTTITQTEIPPELRPLLQRSVGEITRTQGRLPLTSLLDEGTAFGTADRPGQFNQAQNEIGRSQRIVSGNLGSRQSLGNRPPETQRSIDTAQRAQGQSTQVPSQFNQLSPIARRQVGLQSPEQNALQRTQRLPQRVGQTPNTFANTREEFNQGVPRLRRYADETSGVFGEVRGQADPRIADLTGLADRQVTGANIQNSPAFQAANQAFQSAILPQVQNSAQQAGLGRSTGLQQSLAQAQAQYLLPVVQGELAREERGIDRGLGARQFGISTSADLGLQEALAQERARQRGVDIGQFGLATGADLGIQQALGEERGLERYGGAEQFSAGLESQIGQQLAGREESQIGRQLDALLQQGAAGERGIQRGQAASQFLSGQQQAAGQQDLQRNLEVLGADERTRALQLQQSQAAIPQLTQLGQLQQDYDQGFQDRRTQNFLRQQALAEQAIYQPFGAFLPSTLGQASSTSGGGKKGK